MIAYTNYPIVALGDKIHEPAPMRECSVISYDGDKYCRVILWPFSVRIPAEIKAGYLYVSAYDDSMSIDVSKLPIVR
jgi:hypothetical protein